MSVGQMKRFQSQKEQSDTRLSHPKKYYFYLLFFSFRYYDTPANTPDSIVAIIAPSQKLLLFEKINQFEKNNKPGGSGFAVYDT